MTPGVPPPVPTPPRVRNARTQADARKVAETVAKSLLVKCSFHGCDPNWGRIIHAVGYSGARIREELIDIYFGGLQACKGGLATKTAALSNPAGVFIASISPWPSSTGVSQQESCSVFASGPALGGTGWPGKLLLAFTRPMRKQSRHPGRPS